MDQTAVATGTADTSRLSAIGVAVVLNGVFAFVQEYRPRNTSRPADWRS